MRRHRHHPLRRRLAPLALAFAAGCGADEPAAPLSHAAEAPRFAGSAACAGCHADESAQWRGSDHALAMQAPSESAPLGDFGGAALDHFGVSTRFSRRGEAFVVETEGAPHEVAYALGVDPLQQLLLAAPGGRLQSFDVAWDARPEATGGARWFHLQTDAIPPDDVLHWMRPSHTWNAMCADCHVTGYEKGYDTAQDRYASRWSELGVGCEACHGAGSRHVAWARAAAAGAPAPGAQPDGAQDFGLEVRLGGERAFRFAPGAAIARRDPPAAAPHEVETCAPCHARRATLADGWRAGRPLLDHYRPALLEAGLYHADGQIDDEVYEYGSFVQSRMFAAGVVCSDCHEPHALRADADGVCSQCHRDAVFATPAHHHHEPGSEAARCVSCHMPAHTYMQIDLRRDHSFRVPRPDLSASLGTPNACGACHAARGDAWAAEAVARWRGDAPPPRPHFASALDAGRRGLPGASGALAALASDATQPTIARASALRELAARPDPATLAAIEGALRDAEPLVRLAALEAAEPWPPEARRRLAAPLLRDPLRALRIEAARVLASLPEAERASLGVAFTRALGEYRATLARDADRPEARVAEGLLALQQGDLAGAQRAYEAALRIEPQFVPASVNLADLHRLAGRDAEGIRVLASALQRNPASAELHHAMGLALVRAGRSGEALAPLERAATLAPEQARFAYVHAVALHDAGDSAGAIARLEAAVARHPGDRDLQQALSDYRADAERAAQGSSGEP